VLPDTFGDEFGSYWSMANLNTLLHALDGASSGVPPSRDYFDIITTAEAETDAQVIVQALRRALDILTSRYGSSDIDNWTAPRPTLSFVHPLGLVLGQIPLSNRATYAQIVELSTPVSAVNVLPLGQSGFISPTGIPDRHFGDQLTLYGQFQHKPMRLLTPTRLYLPTLLRVHSASPCCTSRDNTHLGR
jgi:penicillin amidase